MSKDVNIHIKTPGADKARQDLDGVGRSGKGVGDSVGEGGRKGAEGMNKIKDAADKSHSVLGKLTGQVKAFIGGWLGIQGLFKIFDAFTQKLERIQELQKSIYERSLTFMEIGQALEFQTGTVGKQQYWAKQAAELTEAGGLKEGVAGQMLTSLDIALAAQGGIKNQQVLQLAKELAPFAGAAGLGPEEVTKLFEFAGTAGVAPTAEAYKDYFAKVQAGYTASKATSFGQFMMGLQKGGTAFMTQGGTLEEAISTFAGARAVLPNEALAATAVEQIARLSAGGYEKPRLAMEKALGVKWSDLSMNQRTAALLRYTARIPESQRAQIMTEQGFPPELVTVINKMVSPEALQTMAATRQSVGEATGITVDEQTQAYLNSPLGRARSARARRAGQIIKAGPAFASWQERLEDARQKHQVLVAKGKDRWIPDVYEPTIMAEESILADYDTLLKTLPEGPQRDAVLQLRKDLAKRIKVQSYLPFSSQYLLNMYETGFEHSRSVEALQRLQRSEGQTIINNPMYFNPIAGTEADRLIGPPFTQD